MRAGTFAVVGVVENGNSATLVTVDAGGQLLDRRQIDLTQGLPTHPHHHEGSWAMGRYLKTPGARKITLAEAVSLVERVRESAERGARESLQAVKAAVPTRIVAIALRSCPELPPTIEERIKDNRAQTYADTVMYRHALAGAAHELGWSVNWYDREGVLAHAPTALLGEMGRKAGPPWHAKHKLAAAAALSAMSANLIGASFGPK